MPQNVTIKRYSGGAWNTIYPKANWDYMDNKPSTFTPSSHTHNFSEINNRYESYLGWGGGRNYVGDFGPLDACLVPKLGANRVAGIDGSYITIERSNNSGSSWTTVSTNDYTNAQRKALFTTSAGIYLKYGSVNAITDRLRITMDATSGSVYTAIRKIMMYLSTNGSTGCKVLIETAYYGSPTTWHTVGTYDLGGWSGWNVINIGLPGSGALGGSNSSDHNRYIRFTFSCTGVNSTYTDGLLISSIYMFGGVGWNTPSTLASMGVPYTYDEEANVNFASRVYATKFKENGTYLEDKYLDKSGGTMAGPIKFPNNTALPQKTLQYIMGIDAFASGGEAGWMSKDDFLSGCLKTANISSWALASTKPSYAWNEITDKPSVATLDTNGKVPSSQLPSYVDDVLEYTAKANFPSTGESGKIYVDNTTNLTYRWSGSAYVEISPSLALGTTSSTAFRGDYGNSAYAHAVTNKGSAFASGLYKITTNSEGHVTAATAVVKSDITGLGIPGSDTNTWRPIAINGTVKINNSSSNLNFIAQGAASVEFDSQTNSVVIGATDTNTWRPIGTGANDAAAGNHTHSQYLTSHQDISGKADIATTVKYNQQSSGIGSASTFANAKAWVTSANLPNGNALVYNTAGTEYSLLFSFKNALTYGTILRWGYNDKYIYIARNSNNVWQSTDWEKISAGYADSAGSAGSVDWSNVSNKPTIPTNTNQLTNGAGYTTNTGTVTSVAVKMNGSTKGTITTSGTIDLGTVITDVSGKLGLTGGNGLPEGTSDVTDNTEIITSYASNNGFADSNATVGTLYRRDAVKVYNYIKSKLNPSSSNNTASWGSAVVVGTVGGVDLKFTMPANPNTNTWRPVAINGTTKIASSISDALNLKAGANINISYSTNGEVVIAANEDTNSWRKVQLNGTDKLGSGTGTNPLNIKAGSNMTITESGGTFTFAATDTNTWRPLGTGADQAAAGNHTHTTIVGSYTTNGGQQNPNYFGTNRVGALMMNTTVNGNSQYKDWLFMDCYNGSDVGGGVAIGVNRQSLGLYIMRSAAARTSWAESAELIGTHNLSTYVKSWAQAANKPSYSFSGSAVTSGANSGTAVAAVTAINAGSGGLEGNTTSSGGIPYVEASLSGTELTLTVKYLHHSHTGASVKTTANAAPNSHTHSVTAAGSVS